MVDRVEQVVHRATLGAVGTRYLVAEVIKASTSDTVTLGDFADITAVSAYRLDTGASITATEATNIVTITQAALTDVPIVIFATGY